MPSRPQQSGAPNRRERRKNAKASNSPMVKAPQHDSASSESVSDSVTVWFQPYDPNYIGQVQVERVLTGNLTKRQLLMEAVSFIPSLQEEDDRRGYGPQRGYKRQVTLANGMEDLIITANSERASKIRQLKENDPLSSVLGPLSEETRLTVYFPCENQSPREEELRSQRENENQDAPSPGDAPAPTDTDITSAAVPSGTLEPALACLEEAMERWDVSLRQLEIIDDMTTPDDEKVQDEHGRVKISNEQIQTMENELGRVEQRTQLLLNRAQNLKLQLAAIREAKDSVSLNPE